MAPDDQGERARGRACVDCVPTQSGVIDWKRHPGQVRLKASRRRLPCGGHTNAEGARQAPELNRRIEHQRLAVHSSGDRIT